MSLSGNLKTMDLAELLQWLLVGRKTGSLTFILDKAKNYIYFRDGQIISSSSNDPTKYLGQFLLFRGDISESQLKTALEIQQRTAVVVGKVLIQEGFLTKETIEKALESRTAEVIYDLFLWDDGYFHFSEEGYKIDDLIIINVNINAILFEGIRRKDEWGRIRAVFPSNNVTLSLRQGADLKTGSFTSLQKKLLFLVTQGKMISDMILELHGSDFLVNFELFQLYDQNLIDVKEILQIAKEPDEPDKLFSEGLVLMKNGKFTESIVAFQKILRTDPQNLAAHEQIDVAEKEICQQLYKNSIPPDKIPFFLIPEATLSNYNLNHQEGFVASRINGDWDLKSIVMLSPLREFEILQIINKFIK